MKTLFVLRHAKSSWKDDTLADHDRPLNKRGKRAAPTMGMWARANEVWPDVVISSTALRARNTAEAFLQAGKYSAVPLEIEASLYHASAEEMVSLVQGRSEHALMLVGHNPGMESLVESLAMRPLRFVTAAFAWFELPIEHWSELTLNTQAHLRAFWVPKELPSK